MQTAAPLEEMSADDLGKLFAYGGFLASALEPIIDLRRTRPAESNELLAHAFSDELSPIAASAPAILAATIDELTKMQLRETKTVSAIAALIGFSSDSARVRGFAQVALTAISAYATRESAALQTSVIDHSIYRAFDALDSAFAINYEHERGMKIAAGSTERLYEGAGLGVQTSYMTLLLALETLNLAENTRVIDLGSGYGRMGLIGGILRSDVEFIGYEFVPHRVDASNSSAAHAGLSAHVHFAAQDLSRDDFRIPKAHVYYLYDPFTEETYRHVFAQLRDLGRQTAITVVTKGRAGAWFEGALGTTEWSVERSLDLGTLWIFRSTPTS